MAEIEYAYEEELTRQYFLELVALGTWHEAMRLTASAVGRSGVDLVAGATYLLKIRSCVSGDSTSGVFGYRLREAGAGSAIPYTFHEERFSNGGQGNGNEYSAVIEYTAPDPPVDIIFEQATIVQLFTGSVSDQTTILMLRIDDLPSSDYVSNEDAVNAALTAAPVDHASITFTPDNDGDEWLILASSRWDVNDVVSNTFAQIRRDGTEAAPAELAPINSEEGEDVREELSRGMLRTFVLDDTSHTIAVQMYDESGVTPDNHDRTFVCALRLNRFVQFVTAWTAAFFTGGVAWSQSETLSVTPAVQRDYFVFSNQTMEVQFGLGRTYSRVQDDGTSVQAGMGTDALVTEPNDADDQRPATWATVHNMDAAAHTIDQDYAPQTPGFGPDCGYRALVVVTTELVDAVGGALEVTLLPLTGAGPG